MNIQTLKAPKEHKTTCVVSDPLLFDIVELAEQCPYQCALCPIEHACEKWLNRYIELSTTRPITPHEQQKAFNEWSKFALQGRFNQIIMR